MNFASHRDSAFRGGVEFVHRHFWIRGGYESLTSDLEESLGNFSFGGGLRIKGWKVDYAWVPRGDLGDQHQVALTIGFGLTPEDRDRLAQDIDKAMEQRRNDQALTYFKEGQAALRKGKLESARLSISRTLMMDPNFKEARETLRLIENKTNLKEANRHFEQGQKLAAKNKWLDAALEWQQTLKLIPSHKKAKEALKKAKQKIEKPKTVASLKQTKLRAAYDKGLRFYLDAQYEAALTEWRKVEKKSPHDAQLKFYMEKAEKMILKEELKNIKQFQASSNDQIIALTQKAYSLYMLGKTQDAIHVWEKILILEPQNKEAKLAVRQAKEKQQLYGGISQGSTANRVYELKVKALKAYSNGHLKRAASLWRNILELDPGNERVQNNLSRIESELQRKR